MCLICCFFRTRANIYEASPEPKASLRRARTKFTEKVRENENFRQSASFFHENGSSLFASSNYHP